MSYGFHRDGRSNVDVRQDRDAASVDHPFQQPTIPHGGHVLTEASAAKLQGYTGSQCDICFSMRMRVSGHCMVCEECGNTTGCS